MTEKFTFIIILILCSVGILIGAIINSYTVFFSFLILYVLFFILYVLFLIILFLQDILERIKRMEKKINKW